MFHYAQIDLETGFLVSDSWLSGIVDEPHMIAIPDDFAPFGNMYVDGKWIPVPEAEPEETETEETFAEGTE